MSLNAISEAAAIGVVQPIQPLTPASGSTHTATTDTAAANIGSAQPIATGTPHPLSPAVLAALVAEQVHLYGSFSAA